MSVNRVILVGNVGQDPEIRATKDGRELANFSLATTENWKDKSTGERKDKTEWHRVVVFSQGLVGVIKNYVKKGSKLYIEGQICTRKYTDKQGIEKYTTEIVLQNFNSSLQMLDSRNSDSGNSYNNAADAVKGEFEGAKEVAPAQEELNDDIPF
jgi:single-strand DNA-binding protein